MLLRLLFLAVLLVSFLPTLLYADMESSRFRIEGDSIVGADMYEVWNRDGETQERGFFANAISALLGKFNIGGAALFIILAILFGGGALLFLIFRKNRQNI